MKLTVLSVGRLRSAALASVADEYAKRIGRYANLRRIDVRESRGVAKAVERRSRESDALLAATPAGAFTVALDERGTLVGSQELAKRLEKAAVTGRSQWAFWVGGAEGHADLVRKKADWVWSLSPLTLPHELAQVVLLEQLYRAMTIRAGEKYHREG